MTFGNLTRVTPRHELARAADAQQERLVAAKAGLIVHGDEPLTCETPPASLDAPLTPTATFYRRNHFPVPLLDETRWRLDIGGLVNQELSLSLHELIQLPAETMAVTLECAGNNRARLRPSVSGVQWGPGAVGTAEWTGPRLEDVLRQAGVLPGAREVIFTGADQGTVEDAAGPIRFERSMLVADALECGALLAYAMNGRPLAARHGYPLRLVVPGWYAMASVKWLTGIRVTDQPFGGYFQTRHYVYERGSHREPVRLMQVRALITRPVTGQRLPRGAVAVRGAAWSGAAPIARVDVSVAGGPWQKARLTGVPESCAWQQWEFLATGLGPGETTIRARATDVTGQVQPERPRWNRFGYAANVIQAVQVVLS
jgi:DMSO/TMAO reductase YedYZ molybdopterin-dependent catalytic subunit